MSVNAYPPTMDPTLKTLEALQGQPDTAPYFSGVDQAVLMTVTPFARSLLDDADASAWKATLDVGTGQANKLAVWSDADTLTFDTDLHWDATNNRLGIGIATPTAPITFSNSLGPKIDLWQSAGTRYGLGIQGSQLQVYAEPNSQVRLGHMASDGTTFSSRLDVNPTTVVSNVSLGILTAPSHTLDVNGYGKMTGIGLNGDPVAGYALYSPSGNWSYFNGAVGIATASPGYTLHVNGTAYMGNTFVNALLGVGLAPNASYNIYTGSARFTAAVYGDAGFDINTLNVRSGSNYIAGVTGIGRGASPSWSLCVGTMYADGQVQANDFYARSIIDCYNLNVRSGNNFFGGLVGIGWGANASYWLNVPSIHCSSLAMDGSLVVNGNVNIGTDLYLDSYSWNGTNYYKWMVSCNPSWDWCRVVGVHYPGSWAGVRIASSGSPYADFNLSGGSATLNVGTWIDAPSDRQVKTGITPIDNPLGYLQHMQGCYYERTDLPTTPGFPAPQTTEYGLIAQDVALALPEAAFEHDYGGHQGVLWNYTNRPVLALLVEAVKALAAKVEALEAHA